MISRLAHSGNDHSSNWRKFLKAYPRMVFVRRKIPDRGRKELMFLYKERCTRSSSEILSKLSFLCLGMVHSNWSRCIEGYLGWADKVSGLNTV